MRSSLTVKLNLNLSCFLLKGELLMKCYEKEESYVTKNYFGVDLALRLLTSVFY